MYTTTVLFIIQYKPIHKQNKLHSILVSFCTIGRLLYSYYRYNIFYENVHLLPIHEKILEHNLEISTNMQIEKAKMKNIISEQKMTFLI